MNCTKNDKQPHTTLINEELQITQTASPYLTITFT